MTKSSFINDIAVAVPGRDEYLYEGYPDEDHGIVSLFTIRAKHEGEYNSCLVQLKDHFLVLTCGT